MTALARKITAVLPVAAIEPALPFWDALGFARGVEVPHGGRLGFVILAGDGVEVMYQTHASIADDLPAIAAEAADGKSFLFIEVADIDAVERALADWPQTFPRRQTFYGSTEIGWREPGGHHITFAQFPDTD